MPTCKPAAPSDQHCIGGAKILLGVGIFIILRRLCVILEEDIYPT